MSETQTLGPWLERYLLEYIVTERNLARNTQKSSKLRIVWPCATSRPSGCSSSSPNAGAVRLRKTEKACGSSGRARPLVQAGAPVPRPPRGRAWVLHPDPQPAPDGHPRLCALRGRPRPGSYRMVRPNPCDSIEEGNATAYHLADQDRDECHARCSRPEDLTRSNRIRSSAVPLQHRGACLRSDAVDSGRSADRSEYQPLCSRDLAWKGQQDTPMSATTRDRKGPGGAG